MLVFFFLIIISVQFSGFHLSLSLFTWNLNVHIGILFITFGFMWLITGSINDTRSTHSLIRISLYLLISHPRLFFPASISSPLQFLMVISSRVRERIYHSIYFLFVSCYNYKWNFLLSIKCLGKQLNF